eukprot:524279_1
MNNNNNINNQDVDGDAAFSYISRVGSFSNAFNNAQFSSHLTNLAGANGLLMNDVVADMEGNGDDTPTDDDEHVTIGMTAGGPDMDETDESDENMNINDNDVTPPMHQNNIINDDDDIDIIGAYETMGRDEPSEQPTDDTDSSQVNTDTDDDDESKNDDDAVITKGGGDTMGNDDGYTMGNDEEEEIIIDGDIVIDDDIIIDGDDDDDNNVTTGR